MKIKITFFLILTSVISYSQYTKIPDINFETKLIALGIDSGVVDGKVLIANVVSVEELRLTDSNITDLTGIEDFKNLLSLKCSSNKLKSLDVSKNSKLLYLDCGHNELSSLKTNNVVMYGLFCSSNQLTNLDLTKNTELIFIDCSSNKSLINIDFSKNIKLEKLLVRRAGLINLNLSKNIALKDLDCGDNELTNLELFNNLKIQTISCELNKIKSLDFSKNPNLYSLMCSANDLRSLNIKNGSLNFNLQAIMNPKLKCITVDNVDVAMSNKSWGKDAGVNYSLNCNNDVGISDNKETISVPNN